MTRRSLLIGGVAGATAATAIVGSLATNADSVWYRTRDKPGFTPPTWAFPVAWTLLFADLAAVGGTTLADLDEDDPHEDEPPHDARDYAIALGTNLALNASWTIVFFRRHNLPLATLWAAALTVSGADLVRRTAKVSRSRGAVLALYPAWCGFATVLSGAFWRRNGASRSEAGRGVGPRWRRDR